MLSDFTTPAEVRAALGVSHKELPDSVIELELYSQALEHELYGIGPGLAVAFLTTAGLAASARTEAEVRLYRAVKLFAPYQVAAQLGSGAPLFAVKSVTDGKSGFTRDSNSPYKEVIAKVNSRASQYHAALVAAYTDVVGGNVVDTVRPYLQGITPLTDPVLGT